MEEFTNKIKVSLVAVGRSVKAFSFANRVVLLSGLTAISIVLIVWARLGFTFEFSRFNAAPVPAVLTVQCGSSQNILTWTLSPDRDSNSILRNRDGENAIWVCGGPYAISPCTNLDVRTFTDTDIQPGHTYRYVHKSAPDSSSNPVTCSTLTPTATPVPTVVLTPTPTALPTLVATPTSSPIQSIIPTPVPTVTATMTPQPSPVAAVTLVATGVNTSSTGAGYTSTVNAMSDQHVSVQTVLRNNNSSATLQGVTIRASLPAGLVYVPGSTLVNGVSASVDSLTTGGLSVGALTPGQTVTVVFRVQVNGTSFAVGQSQASVVIQATASNAQTSSGAITVLVSRSAVTETAGTVQTGPGDATVAALLISAVMTLLYVSYTHTSVFRRREADSISHSKDPMDFRG